MNTIRLSSALLAVELAVLAGTSNAATRYTEQGSTDAPVSTKPLGCIVGAHETTFRVFAPRATAVSLVVFDRHDDPRGVERPMARDEEGVWEAFEPGRLYGKYYGYRIAGPIGQGEMFDPDVIVADPYSRAVVTRNVWRHTAKTLILDTSYDWEGDTFVVPADHNRLIIYEAHLRDMTAHPSSGVRAPGTYLGMVEKGRRGGLSYLQALGVNAVEFLPLQDFGNIELPFRDHSVMAAGYPLNTWNPYARNHWGYMTSFFFAPETYYASDGTMEPGRYNGVDGRAVREMKDMVKALHREGLAVIMDVVYNHVSNYDFNPFKYIDKKYYFRLNPDGTFRSDSGTGNDFATERPMARRVIVESVEHWMTEYHVDGFRFDLAAMIDWETCLAITEAARRINPNVVLIAEPWGGGKYDPAGFSDIGWAAWNDRIRNGVKGRNPHGPVPDDGPGFIFGRREGGNTKHSIESYVTGTLREDGGLFRRKEHGINYLESHDDNTMGDYIRMVTGSVAYGERVSTGTATGRLTPRQLALNKLAAAFLLTSQGPVMIAEGQEYARSKVIAATPAPDPKVGRIDDNSYEKDNDTNYLDYRHADLNRELVDYYRGLIALRQRHPIFGSAPKSAVTFVNTGDDRAIAYSLTGPAGERFIVVLNGNPDKRLTITLPPGRWTVLANAKSVSPTRSLGTRSGRALVPATSALVLRQNG